MVFQVHQVACVYTTSRYPSSLYFMFHSMLFIIINYISNVFYPLQLRFHKCICNVEMSDAVAPWITYHALILLSLQEIVRGGISLSAIFDYRLTPELSTAVCYINSPISVSSCVGIYDEWPDNRIVLDTWYQFRRVEWCRVWGVPYVSLHRYIYFPIRPGARPIMCISGMNISCMKYALIMIHAYAVEQK